MEGCEARSDGQGGEGEGAVGEGGAWCGGLRVLVAMERRGIDARGTQRGIAGRAREHPKGNAGNSQKGLRKNVQRGTRKMS
eukprot:355542-Chlamydomonas_euryale.AAC.3